MTKEEAIKYLQYIGMSFVPTDQYGDYDDPRPYEEALDMAIEALKGGDAEMNEVNPKQYMQQSLNNGADLISRDDAIDALSRSSIYAWSIEQDQAAHNWALTIIKELPSAEAVEGYTEWLEKIIVEAETLEWLCEDTTDEEWCEKNCNYASIQAKCLRHLYIRRR